EAAFGVLEIANPSRGPERGERGALGLRRELDGHLEKEGLTAERAAELGAADARLFVAAVDDPRLAVDERRELRGRELASIAGELEREAVDAGRGRARELRGHLLVDPLAGVDELGRALRAARQIAQQEIAHVRADPERVDADATELVDHARDDLGLVP